MMAILVYTCAVVNEKKFTVMTLNKFLNRWNNEHNNNKVNVKQHKSIA